jgi:hypothetical protein
LFRNDTADSLSKNWNVCVFDTGKSLSEALIFASANPQYDDRLFIVHENCKLRIAAEHVLQMLPASEKD